jgi:hypothetical protein
MINDKLDFKLPPFKRITWVSEVLQIKWEPIIMNLSKAIDNVFISDKISDIIPIQIKSLPINDLFNFKKQIISIGLFAEQINDLPLSIMLFFGLKIETNKIYVIIGNRQNVILFIKGLKEANSNFIVNDLHLETFTHWEKFSESGMVDNIWSLMNQTDNTLDKFSSQTNNLLNPLWKRLGISSIPYTPASLNCKHSLETGSIIQSYAKEILTDELYNSWYEILSWPVEWSALHGIAEIKTPIFKMIYNTDATGEKYTLQLESDTYPENGLNGLLFPYRKPKKLYFTDSKKNVLGMKHLSETLKTNNI